MTHAQGEPAGDSQLFAGSSGWSCPNWLGPFFHRGTPDRDFFDVYNRNFGAPEIDSAVWRIAATKLIDTWNIPTPNRFRFAPKVLQVTTYESRLMACEVELATFLDVMRRLGPKPTPPVFQFDSSFQPDVAP